MESSSCLLGFYVHQSVTATCSNQRQKVALFHETHETLEAKQLLMQNFLFQALPSVRWRLRLVD